MPLPLSRRQFLWLSALGGVGASAYGLARGIRRVQEAARRTADT